jgi:hypothetical protein
VETTSLSTPIFHKKTPFFARIRKTQKSCSAGAFGLSSKKSTAEDPVLMMAERNGFVGRRCQTLIPIGVSQKRPTINTAPAAHEIRQSP